MVAIYMHYLANLIASLATAGSDYRSVIGEITFEANQTSVNITLDIMDDTHPELDESIYIRLTSANLLQEEGSGGNGQEVMRFLEHAIILSFVVSNKCKSG